MSTCSATPVVDSDDDEPTGRHHQLPTEAPKQPSVPRVHTSRLASDRHTHYEHAEAEVVNERMSTLINRERKVLDRLVSGQCKKEVAWDLDVSNKAIEAHRARLVPTMKVSIYIELVHLILVVRCLGAGTVGRAL